MIVPALFLYYTVAIRNCSVGLRTCCADRKKTYRL
jgi:hypothetical protein